uniref:Fibronectin type-III domain-containing protein n=1 Tax=Falco tinnunculus TaxID=100819 RepID=A0A8C4TME8_FALTI
MQSFSVRAGSGQVSLPFHSSPHANCNNEFTNCWIILGRGNIASVLPNRLKAFFVLRYGEKSWLSKRECQSITQPFCNLTRETENFTEHYYARVRATGQNYCSSDWVRSERFEPRKESTYRC